MKSKSKINYAFPDENGRFGEFGGKYVSETLITALEELEKIYSKVKNDKSFQEEVIKDLNDFVGRPSPPERSLQLPLALPTRLHRCRAGASLPPR